MGKKLVLINFLLFVMGQLHSQTIISGIVTNLNKEPLSGASISMENSYDGTTSATDGSFSFHSPDTGLHKIIITIMGYKKFEVEVLLAGNVFYYQGIAIVVGILPIIIYTLYAQNHWLHQFKQEAGSIQKKLEQKRVSELADTPIPASAQNDKIIFESDNQAEKKQLMQIIYFILKLPVII